MRLALAGFLVIAAAGTLPAQPRAKDLSKTVKPGIQTPGVQIPLQKLRPDAEFSAPGSPESILVDQSVWIVNRSRSALEQIDPTANKLIEPVLEFNKPCGNPQSGFGSIWLLDCGAGTLARLDANGGKISETMKTGACNVRAGLADSPDSVWSLNEDKKIVSSIYSAESWHV